MKVGTTLVILVFGRTYPFRNEDTQKFDMTLSAVIESVWPRCFHLNVRWCYLFQARWYRHGDCGGEGALWRDQRKAASAAGKPNNTLQVRSVFIQKHLDWNIVTIIRSFQSPLCCFLQILLSIRATRGGTESNTVPAWKGKLNPCVSFIVSS